MHLADAIALVLILSFVLETFVRGLISIPLLSPRFSGRLGINSAGEMEDRPWYRPVHFLLATVLGVSVCVAAEIGALSEWHVNPAWDHIVTGMLLMAGSDRVLALKKQLGGSQTKKVAGPDRQPIQVTGKFTMDRSDRKGAADTDEQAAACDSPGSTAARGAAAG